MSRPTSPAVLFNKYAFDSCTKELVKLPPLLTIALNPPPDSVPLLYGSASSCAVDGGIT